MIDSDSILLYVCVSASRGRVDAHTLRKKTGQSSAVFSRSLKKCLDAEILAATCYMKQLHKAASLGKLLTTPHNLYITKHNRFKKQLHKQQHVAVSDIIKQATDRRNFNADYQAVVSGKKARRDPVMQFFKKMNWMDRGDALAEYFRLSDVEQSHFRARISR